MKKLLTIMATMIVSYGAFADSNDCDYRGNGGFSSPACHVLNQERLDALEDQIKVLDDFLGKVDRGDFNGKDGKDGVDGKDGMVDQSFLNKVTEDAKNYSVQSAAIASLLQSPHDRSGLSLGCANGFGQTECAIGATWAVEGSNSMLHFVYASDIRTLSWGYHFGK